MTIPPPPVNPVSDLAPGVLLLTVRVWDAPDFPGTWSIWDMCEFVNSTRDAAQAEYAKWHGEAFRNNPVFSFDWQEG